MSEHIALGYGRDEVLVEIPDRNLRGVLEPQIVAPAAEDVLVKRALAEPLDTDPLYELARMAGSAVILVSGRDRVTRADLFIPQLTATLQHAGITKEAITVIVATGTHIPFTVADKEVIVGPSLHPSIRVIGHDCMDRAQQVCLGTTSFGNTIWVNRLAYEADVKILTGRLTHHYFAGFTAGRKAVLPGVAGFDTIKFNHRLVLSGSPEHPRHPQARNGNLDGNPVHLDMLEAAALFRPTFVLNTILNSQHELIYVASGHPLHAHLAGCRVVAGLFEVQISIRSEMAVASCGGHPYDCSFMQAIKTLINNQACVMDGGVFVLLASCPEGIKPGFLNWPIDLSLAELADTVKKNYNLTGHNTYLIREILSRIRVVFVSNCPSEQVKRIGFVPAHTWREGMNYGFQHLGTSAPSLYILPYGNVTVVGNQ